MKSLLRQVFFLSLATALTWLFIWGPTGAQGGELAPASDPSQAPIAALDLLPALEPAPEASAPPTFETGVVDGEENGAPPVAQGQEGQADEPLAELESGVSEAVEPAESSPQEALPEEPGPSAEVVEASSPQPSQAAAPGELMEEPELLAAASEELEGKVRKGFQTVFVGCTAEQQLEIARFFGEELVLIPRSALDPGASAPAWYRLDAQGQVERIEGAPDLERFRQYRDLFDYDYAGLPAPIRALRRVLMSRSDIFLFAASIPPREWAVVIGRRRDALERSGRSIEDVERFTLRYVRLGADRFDLQVEEIRFRDGQSYRPAARPTAGSSTTSHLSRSVSGDL